MFLRTTFLGTLLFLLVLTSGCDSDSTRDDLGTFSLAIRGAHQLDLEGPAAFATQTEDGHTVTAIGMIAGNAAQDGVVLVLQGLPRTGTFNVVTEEAGGLFARTDNGEDAIFVVQSGTLTVTQSSADRLAGRFDMRAASLTDETDVVTIRGTFDAERGEVDDAL